MGAGTLVVRWSWLFGILGSLIIVGGALIAALSYTGKFGEPYSPLNHFVSELGEPGVSALSAVFNGGLTVGGALLTLFMIGTAHSLVGSLRWGFGVIGSVAGISGLLVGIFPMNRLGLHTLAALTFFITGWLAIALFSLAVWCDPQARYPRWLVVPGAASVISFIGFLVTFGQEARGGTTLGSPVNRPDVWLLSIFEWLVFIMVLVWAFLVSVQQARALPAAEVAEASA